jgi:hypothetical protein
MRGAPTSPSRSTSHPASASTPWRAAPKHVRLAVCPPVTKPTLASSGRPNRSVSHRPASSSTAASAGLAIHSPAFWSHAEVSQSAASAAGWLPPMT